MTTTTHKIHDRLPSGFTYANAFQAEEYATTGIVRGASKVVLVSTGLDDETDLAVRLRPPSRYDEIAGALPREEIRRQGLCATQALAWYKDEYNKGWDASRRCTGMSPATSHSYDDGYLDRAAGRPKWHLTYCTDHDNCGEG